MAVVSFLVKLVVFGCQVKLPQDRTTILSHEMQQLWFPSVTKAFDLIGRCFVPVLRSGGARRVRAPRFRETGGGAVGPLGPGDPCLIRACELSS